MEVKIEELKRLLEEKFQGNQTLFAETLGIDRTHVNKVFKNGKGARAVFCGAIIKYCKENNLNEDNYISFGNKRNKITKTS